MKGRKPRPLGIALMKGDHKGRVNHNQPAPPIGLPRCPAHLDKAARAKWRQLAKEMTWMAKVDGDILAAYCVAWARWVDAEEKVKVSGAVLKSTEGGFYQNPFLAVANKAIEQLTKLGSLMGLNPAERTRINAPVKNREDDALQEFIDEVKKA